MKNIRKVYPDLTNKISDYTPMLESLGYKIIIHEIIDDYHSILFKDGSIFGWLGFHPSDTDTPLSYKDLDRLQRRLDQSISWKGNANDTLAWLSEKTPSRISELFVARCMQYIKSKVYRDRFKSRQKIKELLSDV